MMVVFFCDLMYTPLQYLDYVDDNRYNDRGNLDIMAVLKMICIVDMITRFFFGYLDETNNFVVSWDLPSLK